MKKDFEVGQVWVSRNGEHWTITEICSSVITYNIHAENSDGICASYTEEGCYYGDLELSNYDLIKLASDTEENNVDHNDSYKKQLWISVYTSQLSNSRAEWAANKAKEAIEQFEKYFEQS